MVSAEYKFVKLNLFVGLILSGDKNVTFAKHFVIMQKTVQEIEANLLNGRKLLGPLIAAEVFAFLQKEQLQDE